MIKKLSVFCLMACFTFLFTSNNTQAQSHDYDLAVGARFANGLGVSAKNAIGNNGNYVEGILYLGGFNSIALTALYEVTNPIANSEVLDWYYGGGVSLFAGNGLGSNVGVDGIIGAEWQMPFAPLNLSLDFKPTVLSIGTEGLRGLPVLDSAACFTLRYIIR